MTTTIAHSVATEAASIGHGRLVFSHVDGRTRITRNRANNPLKLLTPDRGGPAAWAYTSTYGGGLVSGDEVNLDVCVQPSAVGVVTTQASTKVFHGRDGRGAKQHTTASVGDGGILVFAPDPLVCFKDAIYHQKQNFELAKSGGLVLLDWFTSGRLAMGERWALNTYTSQNRIAVDGKVVFNDRTVLDGKNGPIDSAFRVGHHHCFATVVMVGEMFNSGASALAARINEESLKPRPAVLVGANVMVWGTILRLAGVSTELVEHKLRDWLSFLRTQLGAELWDRRW